MAQYAEFQGNLLGYHQMPLHPEYQERITLITDWGLYCYNVMSFCLKNVGVIYQHLVIKDFIHLIWKSMEVFAHNMIVKSKSYSKLEVCIGPGPDWTEDRNEGRSWTEDRTGSDWAMSGLDQSRTGLLFSS